MFSVNLSNSLGGKIIVKIPSFAASAATISACVDDTVEISPLAVMCIHNPFLNWVSGEEKDMLKAAEYLSELKENIINAYEMKTKLSREEISKLMDDETYLNAKKAVELHFADKFMFEENPQSEEMTAEMRHRITIQRPVTYTDDEGNIIEETSSNLQTVWAKILPTASKISDGYVEQVQEIIYRIVVRANVDIRVTDKILWQGKTFEVIAPPYYLEGKKKFQIVEARELVEDGEK